MPDVTVTLDELQQNILIETLAERWCPALLFKDGKGADRHCEAPTGCYACWKKAFEKEAVPDATP